MIRKTITYIKEDVFLKNNAVFFIGSIVTAFLNYLYYPVMSRLMTVERFGEVQTIFSFVFLSGVILTVFRMIVLHIASNRIDEGVVPTGPPDQNDSVIASLFTATLATHLPFVILLIVASPALSEFFAFETSWNFAVFALYFTLTIPFTFYGAHLTGKSKFGTVSIANIIQAFGKLIFAALFVILGLDVFGAIGALVIASFLALLYIRTKSKDFLLSLTPSNNVRRALKKEFSYGLLILISLGLVTFLYAADVLVVKRLFSPEIAGTYSGIATIARIIFFATGSISTVLLSSIKIRNTPAINQAILLKATLFVCMIGGSALLLFTLFPNQIITLLIGKKFVPMAHHLPYLSLYLFLVSLLNLFVAYFIALRLKSLLPISALGFLGIILLLALNHHTLQAIIFDFTFATLGTLSLLVFSAFVSQKNI